MTIDPELLTGLGTAMAIFLSASGSAIASSQAGIYAVRGKSPKAFIPIIISGVLAIYGIIIAVLLCGKFKDGMAAADGYRHLSAGLSVGLACCASGFGLSNFIKNVNEEQHMVVHRNMTEITEPLVGRRDETFVPGKSNFAYMVLCLVFMEAIGLYGLIVALVLIGN